MSEKPATAPPRKSTGPEASDTTTDPIRSQPAERQGIAPAEPSARSADIARTKIADLGISEVDVADAIRWARSTEQSSE